MRVGQDDDPRFLAANVPLFHVQPVDGLHVRCSDLAQKSGHGEKFLLHLPAFLSVVHRDHQARLQSVDHLHGRFRLESHRPAHGKEENIDAAELLQDLIGRDSADVSKMRQTEALDVEGEHGGRRVSDSFDVYPFHLKFPSVIDDERVAGKRRDVSVLGMLRTAHGNHVGLDA